MGSSRKLLLPRCELRLFSPSRQGTSPSYHALNLLVISFIHRNLITNSENHQTSQIITFKFNFQSRFVMNRYSRGFILFSNEFHINIRSCFGNTDKTFARKYPNTVFYRCSGKTIGKTVEFNILTRKKIKTVSRSK